MNISVSPLLFVRPQLLNLVRLSCAQSVYPSLHGPPACDELVHRERSRAPLSVRRVRALCCAGGVLDLPLISSTKNARVRDARQLQQRRHRERRGEILLEGVRLVRDAASHGAELRTVYFSTTALECDNRLQDLQGMLPLDVEQFRVSDAVLGALSDTVAPQGVVAVASRPSDSELRTGQLLLVADGLSDPGNLGTLLRSATAAGVTQVAVIGKGAADVWGPKALRAAMGAHFHPSMRIAAAATWPQLHAALAGAPLYVASAGAGTAYSDVNWSAPAGAALVVGSEADGPSRDALESPGAQRIHIPMAPGVESLNAAMAGTIVLFEAQRQRLAG